MFQDKLTQQIAAAAAQIKTEPPKNEVNTKSVEGAVMSIMTNEELKGNQHKIDANKNGKIDAHDFKLLRAKKDVKKEEVEQLDEVGDTPAGRKTLHKYVDKAISTAMYNPSKIEKRAKGMRKATSRLYKDNYYGKKNEEVEQIEEAGDLIKGVKRFMAGKKNPSDVRDAHLAKSAFSSDPKVKERESRRYDRVQNVLSKEDVELDEAFPTVADAKKRMASKDSSFEKKKISTGTVYSRKYKAEPDDADDMPKKKAKTMKEMLDIYRQHGAESLVENLMIEEPTNDEYKKEAEIAQAKSEGKIRNDKQIAKAASQGVKMEEVEIEEGIKGAGIGAAVGSVAGGPVGAAIGGALGHVAGEVLSSAKNKTKAMYRIAKGPSMADSKMKREDVEIQVLDADEINGVQIDNIEERSMTEPEMKKREEIVKSMKKGIQGFKDRYGDRAKNVMYATATKNAMKD